MAAASTQAAPRSRSPAPSRRQERGRADCCAAVPTPRQRSPGREHEPISITTLTIARTRSASRKRSPTAREASFVEGVLDPRFAGIDWPARSTRRAWSTSGAGSSRGAGIGIASRGSGRCAPGWCACGLRWSRSGRPDGLLIERLLHSGLAVIAVHPKQVKAMRPRYSVAGGKSDSFDSFVLAQLARADSHRFRVLVSDSDRTKAPRAMTRARVGLVRTRTGLANQLRDQLACFWPGASKVCWSVDSQIALAFLRRYPPRRCPRSGRAALGGVSQASRLPGPQARPRARDAGSSPDRAGARLRA